MLGTPGSESEQVIALIRAQRGIATAKELDAFKALARSFLPEGYEPAVTEMRRQYQGHILEGLLQAAQKRFPKTYQRMPHIPFNLLRTVAEKLACAYDTPPQRSIVDEDEESPRSEAFAEMLRKAKAEEKLPEADRRASLAGTCFVHVRPDVARARARGDFEHADPALDLYWTPDVMVLPDPMAPTDLQAVHALIAKVTAPAPGVEVYQHWYRALAKDTAGNEYGVGPWSCDLVTKTTKNSWGRMVDSVETKPLWAPWPLPFLPWVALHAGIPEGPVVDANRNLLPIVNTLNASLMSELYTVDMAAVPVLTHSSNDPKSSVTAIGPGVVVKLLQGEAMDSITQSPDLAGIRATNQAMLQELALTLRISSDAFIPQLGAPASGVALKIKNEPQEKMRREALTRIVPFEQEELLPMLAQVHDQWSRSTVKLWTSTTRFRMVPAERPEYESRMEAQTRLGDAVERRWVDDATAATSAGYYRDVADARTAIEQIKAGALERAVNNIPDQFRAPAERSDATDDEPEPAAPDPPEPSAE